MRLICVHQSADLYGSDRSFLQVLEFFVKSEQFTEIKVVLPRNGPLTAKLEELGVTIELMELSLLSKTYLKKLQWGKIIFPLLQFSKKRALFNSYDVVYVNTSVILDFYLTAPFVKSKKIIHIREIPAKWLSKILSVFLKFSGSVILFNSESTKNVFDALPESYVVHNAFEGFPGVQSGTPVTPVSEPLKVLLIGRINDWKGQDFALEALERLSSKNILLRIVGDTSAGNEQLLTVLKQQVEAAALGPYVEFTGFTADPAKHYQWADVLIVPSKKPEPFGRIAIEAMCLGKPVIAANHGGLPEIIDHGRNGFLFKPGDIESFNGFLEKYMQDRELLLVHGNEAKATFMKQFSTETMFKNLDRIFRDVKIWS